MDLSKLDVVTAADEGALLTLKHPVDESTLETEKGPMQILLVGTDSSTYRNILKNRARQRLNQKKSTKIDLDEAELKGIQLLAKCTLDFINILDDGKYVKYTYEDAIKLYQKYPWIKEQVDEFMSDRSNFLKG